MKVVPAVVAFLLTGVSVAGEAGRFELKDIFGLEFASDPQLAPDARRIVYVRNSMDIMKDRELSRLWIINADGTGHRPLTEGSANEFAPRWSPEWQPFRRPRGRSTPGVQGSSLQPIAGSKMSRSPI